MRIIDVLSLAQSNLLRSKLRTILTVVAVFIGALTISLTNGVGNGIRDYIQDQLGNIGAKDMIVIQASQDSMEASFGSDTVKEYDPEQATGAFNIPTLNGDDIKKISKIDGLNEVSPEYMVNLDYITTGGKKYTVNAQQFPKGLNLQMLAGRTIDNDSTDETILPEKYVKALGFKDNQAAIDKEVTLSFKDAQGQDHQVTAKVVGVPQRTIMASYGIYISPKLAQKIYEQQSSGVASLADNFMAVTARFPVDYTDQQISQLKERIAKAGYSGMTVEDQIGIVNQIVGAIQIALNIFGAIALLAASFGIVNTLLMAVNERTREIGLMKALGANNRTIFAVFSVEAVSLGFWGALLGVLVSMVIGMIVNPIAADTFLKDFDGFNLLAFPIMSSVGVIVMIMIIAFLAGVLPSIKASRLNPIEALRYE